jgi:hypothetical protein
MGNHKMEHQHNAALHHRGSQGLWVRWVLAMTIGELVGFAIPVAVGAGAWSLGLSDLAIAILVTLAGAGEGAVLGFAQWLALRHTLAIERRDWVLATGLAAVVAYAIGMLPSNLGDLSRFNSALLIGVGAVLGVIFLVSIGFAQWLVLRWAVPHAAWWIVANAVAWPLGVAVPVVGLALVPDNAPPVVWIVTGIVCGVLMGVVVGALTGIALIWMLRPGRLKAPVMPVPS